MAIVNDEEDEEEEDEEYGREGSLTFNQLYLY
jgi:hypothetical protein